MSDIGRAIDHARRVESGPVPPGDPPRTVAERAAIVAALDRHGGNRTAAAAEPGISRRQLHCWPAQLPRP